MPLRVSEFDGSVPKLNRRSLFHSVAQLARAAAEMRRAPIDIFTPEAQTRKLKLKENQ